MGLLARQVDDMHVLFWGAQITGTAADAHDTAAQTADTASGHVKYAQDVASDKAAQARAAAGEYAGSAQDAAEQAKAKGSSTWQKVKDTVSAPLLAYHSRYAT